jgi:hypothetical protein
MSKYIDYDYRNEFNESEKANAIKTAKNEYKLPLGYSYLDAPEPNCTINHNSDRSITAKVYLSYKNKEDGFITDKTINLKFHDNNGRSFWSYDSSENG